MSSKKSEIIKYISHNIYIKKFTEDKKIPSETQLSIKFNCSRLTARSALTSLAEAGYINAKKGFGYTVAKLKNHSTFKTIAERFNTDKSSAFKIIKPSDIEIPWELITGADLSKENFDIKNTFVFEKRYFKKNDIIIYQLTFFNKKIIKFVTEEDIESSIMNFLLKVNAGPNITKEFLLPTSNDYFWIFAKNVGWKEKPYPIMLSTIQSTYDWIEFSIRVISPKELTFSRVHKIY